MEMMIAKLYVSTTLPNFDQDCCYRVLGVDMDARSVRFLVADNSKKFRILDNTECEFFSLETTNDEDTMEDDDEDDDDEDFLIP